MDIVRRAEHRRQRQNENERDRGDEAENARPKHDPIARRRHHADDTHGCERACHTVGPRLFHQPSGHAEHDEGGRQLAEIERGERWADQVGPACGGDIVGQERVGDEIHRVDAAEDQAEPPDQRLPPIGPPSACGCGCCRCRAAERRCTEDDKQRGQHDRRRPDDEAQAPAIVHQRQDERNGERNRERLTDEKSVGVNRGGEADALRKPGPHQRRQ